MKKLKKLISIMVAFVLLLAMLPGETATASSSALHEADDALLLMLASHNLLMDGGLAVGNPHMAVVNPQASPNEVDILFDIYAKQLSQLDQMDCSENVKLRLVDELDQKLYALEAKAQRLEAERQNRRRGGLFRRFFRALGSASGWVVSKAMDATGKIVQYSIEEVGPQLLKDAVFSGTPLTGAAFRAKFMEMLRSRGWNVVSHKLETRRSALASEPDSEPTSPPSQTQPASTPTSPHPTQNQPAPQPTTMMPESADESSLTPEEEANAGTHTYRMACSGEGCEYIDESATITITFSDGIMRMAESRESIWTKVDRNRYSWVNVDGDVFTTLFTMNGFEIYVNSADGKLVYILQP